MLHLEMDYEEAILDFPIDRECSSIEGMILAEDPSRSYWSIDINSQELFIPYSDEAQEEFEFEEEGYTDTCHLEISFLEFGVTNWRNLEGAEWEVSYAADDVHPILPGNSGTFFFADQHHVPNKNRILFKNRDRQSFDVFWSCVAEGYPGETGTRISVATMLGLHRIGIYFPNMESVSIQRARELVLLVADGVDVGLPSKERSQWVYFPLQAHVR